MNELKFNSQICTTKEQSERLLELGLKPETADCQFVPPCKFKNGDIIYIKSVSNIEIVAIYKKENAERIYDYCCISFSSKSFYYYNTYGLISKNNIDISRLATEEEKQKLFDTIKANGFKWNAETKTLEELISPKFEVGDRIKQIGSLRCYIIQSIEFDRYILHNNQFIRFEDEHIYELVPNKFDITTLKPFESRVLIRDYNDKWVPSFWGKLLEKDSNCRYLTTCGCYKYCIPYEDNEHLLGTTNDCDEYYKTWE